MHLRMLIKSCKILNALHDGLERADSFFLMRSRMQNEYRDWFLVLTQINGNLVRLGCRLLALVHLLWVFPGRRRTHLLFIVHQVVDFALAGFERRRQIGRTALEKIDVDSVCHLELKVHEVHLQQIHVFFILFGPVLLGLEDLGLACGLTGIVIDTALFRAGCHNETLLNELLVKIDIEVLKYLLVVNETKIAVLRQIILANAVNRIDGTSLELVDVACDHFCSLLGIWQK